MKNEPPAPSPTDGADPSMEEILASIRRILNDDDAPTEASGVAEAPQAEDDVLLLDQSMMVSRDEAASEVADHQAAPAEPSVTAQTAPEAAAAPPQAEPPLQEPHQEMEAATPVSSTDPFDLQIQELVAPEAAAAAASSVGSLVRTLTAGRATQVYAGGPTLEDIVRAELRPLLKEWLDANLPPMVERLVRAEIERVVGRVVP